MGSSHPGESLATRSDTNGSGPQRGGGGSPMGYVLTSPAAIFSWKWKGISFTPPRLELPPPGLSSPRVGYPKLPGGCPELGLIASPDPAERGRTSPDGKAVVSPGFIQHFNTLRRMGQEGKEEEDREHLARQHAPSSSTGYSLETLPFLVEIVDRVVLYGQPLGQNLREAACLAAMDKHASEHWKRLLEYGDKHRVSNSVQVILGFVFRLAVDEVGQYLVRKIISFCDEEILHVVVREVVVHQKQLLETAKNALGVKWVRQLLLLVRPWPALISRLTFALFERAAELMINKHGSGLIKECLSRLSSEQNMFIYAAALDNLKTVAKNNRGCVSLVKIIDHAPPATKHLLLAEIISYSPCFAQDPFGYERRFWLLGFSCGHLLPRFFAFPVFLHLKISGAGDRNYVVQHIFNLGEEEYEERLCWKLRSHLVQLSMQRSGSHVVEKCMASAGGLLFLKDLVSHKKLIQIAQDTYGNFVVNAALRISKMVAPPLHQRLVEALRARSRSLRNHPNGRHVYKNIVEAADHPS